MTTNPFRPSTGASPPELVGRGALLDGTAEALTDGPGAPGRISIFTGQRGIGKTVMLNEVAEVAHQRGWRTLHLTATPGLLDRLGAEVSALLDHEVPPPKRRVTGVHVAGVAGVTVEPTSETATDLRRNVTHLVDALAARTSGLMVTLDEVHGAARAELRELGALTQHLIREDREFALIMAGLPTAVSNLLQDDVLTFLRRADRHLLTALDVDDVQDALEKTFTDNDRRLDPDDSRYLAVASRGYPYLVQLIGYHTWRHTRGTRVTRTSAEKGVADARARLGDLVHEPALQDRSEVDRRFLVAMAEDDGRSSVADVSRRLGKDKHYVNTYRRRLIAAQVIEEAGRGYVRFTMPYLGEHLRERYPDA